MSLDLTIGANVQPAIDGVNSVTKVLQDFSNKGKLSIEVVENSMNDLRAAIKSSSDPAVVQKLKGAYTELDATLKKLKIEGGLEQSLGGVSRATRLAHADIGQLVGSLEGFSRGSSGAVDGVSNLIFTFERLKGVSGGTGGAIDAVAEAFLSPAGLVLAIGAGIPLIIEAAKKFDEMSNGSRQAKEELDALTESLKRNKVLLEGYNEDLDQASVIRKLKIDIETPQGTGRTIADLNVDLDKAHTTLANVTPALKEWQSEVDKLVSVNDKLTAHLKDQHAELSSEGKVLFEGNQKKIDALQKQIDEFKKQESQAKATIAEIPFKIKLVQTDQAAEDVKKAAEKAAQEAKKSASEREREAKQEAARLQSLSTVFAAPDKLDVPSLKNTQVFFDALKADINKKSQAVEIPIAPKIQLRIDARELDLKQVQDQISIISKTLEDSLSAVGEGIGNAVAGGGIKQFFSGILQVIGSGLKQLGQYVIAASALIAKVKAALNLAFAGNPIAGIAVGVGLVALGSILQKSIPKFAEGGIVNKPTLGIFGEAGPEVVMPLDKLKGLLGGLTGSNVNLNGDFKISGNDLVLALNRTQRTQGRGG